jgi:hypothetical protein
MLSHDFSLSTLKPLRFLKSLTVFSPPIKFITHFHQMTSLENLSMEQCSLSTNGICELLSNLQQLKSLMINGTQYVGSLELLSSVNM